MPLKLFPPKVGDFPPVLANPPPRPLVLKLITEVASDADLKVSARGSRLECEHTISGVCFLTVLLAQLCLLIRDQVFLNGGTGCGERRRVAGETHGIIGGGVADARGAGVGAAAVRDEDAMDASSLHILGALGFHAYYVRS